MSDGTESGDYRDSSDPSACGGICPDLRSRTTWKQTLTDWTRDGAILRLADVPSWDNDRLSAFMRCLDKHCKDRDRLPGIDGSGSVFQSKVRLEGKHFTGPVHFDGSRFNDGADFSGSTFDKAAHFRRAVFGEVADFAGSRFAKDAGFEGASFDIGDFRRAWFDGDRRFDGITHTTAVQPNWHDLGPTVPLLITGALIVSLLGLRLGTLTDRGELVYVLSSAAAILAGVLYLFGQRMGWRSPAWPRQTHLVSNMTNVLAALALAGALAGAVYDFWLEPGDDNASSFATAAASDERSEACTRDQVAVVIINDNQTDFHDDGA